MKQIIKYLSLVIATHTFVGCEYNSPSIRKTVSFSKIKLSLKNNENGKLVYCDESNKCVEYPNPEKCKRLEVEIHLSTGNTCETCYADDNTIIRKGCSGTNIACSVVTAPEPDCVVCAYIDGAVIYSTCVAEEPLDCVYYDPSGALVETTNEEVIECDANHHCPPRMVCEEGKCVPDCRICYDTNGREVVTECYNDCSKVHCMDIGCGPGFESVTPPGECCPQCVKVDNCEEVVCPMNDALPECPPDAKLVQDPLDCCHFFCEFLECPEGGQVTDNACPPGYRMDFEFPNCGRCVQVEQNVQLCLNSSECLPEEVCTVELGECLHPSDCDADEVCSDVCYGKCRLREVECPNENDVSIDSPTNTPINYCEGEYVSLGVDGDGCPLPPVCMCPGGITSFDGVCEDMCVESECYTPTPVCREGERLVTDYPYCCGVCVPEDECVPGEVESSTGIGDSSGSASGSFGCPEVHCLAGFHPEIGPDCCEICVRDEQVCQTSDECPEGEYCSTKDDVCNPGPDNQTNVCTGFCVPKVNCEDSDGLDPHTPGWIAGTNAYGQRYEKADFCDNRGNVVEYWCYNLFEGSSQTEHGVTVIECENGCADGACI